MKDRKKMVILWAFPILLLLVLLLAQPAYLLYREAAYRTTTPSAAEKIVHDYSQQQNIPYGKYPPDLIELLDNNPETEAFVLNYPFRKEESADIGSVDPSTVPLFLQWDSRWGYDKYGSSFLAVTGCGPTCLAMVGYHLTGDPNMTPDQIAAFAEKNGYYAAGYGSSWTLISEGSRKLGLEAQELPLVKKKMISALEAGQPVILAMGKGDFTSSGHYIILTGVDEGAFRVHDPNSPIRSQKRWTYEELEPQIRNIWAMRKA